MDGLSCVSPQVVSDTAGAVPVFIGALIVVVWYLHKVVVGVARACQRIGGHMSMEEMTDSAEVIDTGTGQVWVCVDMCVCECVGVCGVPCYALPVARYTGFMFEKDVLNHNVLYKFDELSPFADSAMFTLLFSIVD